MKHGKGHYIIKHRLYASILVTMIALTLAFVCRARQDNVSVTITMSFSHKEQRVTVTSYPEHNHPHLPHSRGDGPVVC